MVRNPGLPCNVMLRLTAYLVSLLIRSVFADAKIVCKDPLTVYKDGFGMGWISGSRGTTLDAYSTLAVRNGTTVSLSSFTEPYADISFQSSAPFCKDTILDMWVQGNLLNRASIVLMSREYDSVSEQVPLWVAEPEMILTSSVVFNGKLRIQGPDVNNWFRVSVNLLDIANNKTPPPSWDTIVIRDNSGRGFSMFLSQATILPSVPNGDSRASKNDCIGSLCNPVLGFSNPSLSSGLVPLFGYTPVTSTVVEDRGMLDDDTLVVNAKLRLSRRNPIRTSSVKNWELIKFCGWIQGIRLTNMDPITPLPPLFDFEVFNSTLKLLSEDYTGENALGKCFLSDTDIARAALDPLGDVVWPILSIRAFSYDDLTAIRKAALDKMEWMDKNEFATKTQDDSSLVYNAAAMKESATGVPWSLSRLDQKNLPVDGQYSVPYDGSGVHVYVLDTGVSPHSDFENRLGEGVNCISGTCQRGNFEDSAGHGTHVAATVGGKVFGVAKGVTINPVKVLGGPSSTGSYAGIISGIKYATEQSKANGWPAVINLSLGGPRSSSLDIAVQMAVYLNVTVAVASGNDFFADACTTSPGAASLAMTVAATNANDLAASFSNIGPCVDIFAPGNDIPSADAGNLNDGFVLMSGTSMAAPHVSGAAALVLQQHPTYNPIQVADAIFNASISRNLAPNTTKRMLNLVDLFS